jgi:hypothetical protein
MIPSHKGIDKSTDVQTIWIVNNLKFHGEIGPQCPLTRKQIEARSRIGSKQRIFFATFA